MEKTKIQQIKILVVDDHQILIDGLFNMLQDTPYQIIDKAKNAQQAMEVLQKKQVDIIICDLQLPGISGLDLIRMIRKKYPRLKIIVLSMHDEKGIVSEAVQLGISAYLLKNISQQKLIYALEKANEDKFYISEELTDVLGEIISRKSPRDLLTARERQVLKLIVNELTNKEIAEKLFISERTVETHRKNIFRKTKTKSLVGLTKFTIDNKLI